MEIRIMITSNLLVDKILIRKALRIVKKKTGHRQIVVRSKEHILQISWSESEQSVSQCLLK